MRDEKLHAVVARSTFVSKKGKNTSRSDHFWKLRCRKVHSVVARSTFPSQNVQNTPAPEHFWKLRCRKSAHRCGATHISKRPSENVKNTACSDRFLTIRWRFGVQKVHAVVARSTFPKSKCTKHTMLRPVLEVEMSKKCTPLWREAHFQVKMYKRHHAQTTFGS